VKFFKINEAGYDSQRKKWANEDVLEHSRKDNFSLPSDIKPGMYILRTELLALHGNAITSQPVNGGGPQFYTHCFNIDITGNGNVEPAGVKFPGAYKREDTGVAWNLYRQKADGYVRITTFAS
jgi:cellulase